MEKLECKLQSINSAIANLASSEDLAYIVMLLGILILQAGVLVTVGEPFITLGAIALIVGAVGGFMMNQLNPPSLANPFDTIKEGAARQGPAAHGMLAPVVVLIPADTLAAIDSALQTKEMLDEGRRRWILIAIREKIARDHEHTPEFPLAA
jgi:hypothetical protein